MKTNDSITNDLKTNDLKTNDSITNNLKANEMLDFVNKEKYCFDDFLVIMEMLRKQCPWDREQTHDSLKRYLIEETYEVLEAIDNKDMALLCEELGDLLLQIVFHASIASENKTIKSGDGDEANESNESNDGYEANESNECDVPAGTSGFYANSDNSFDINNSDNSFDIGNSNNSFDINNSDNSFDIGNSNDSFTASNSNNSIEIGNSNDSFDMSDVITRVSRKMISRHPHVFANVLVNSSSEVLTNWENIKKTEKGLSNTSAVLKKVPPNLPALMRAYKIQQKAADVGFDWNSIDDVFVKVDEELYELRDAWSSGDSNSIVDEMGDAFFALVNLSRFMDVHPELAATASTDKFIRRFEVMEALIQKDGEKLENMTLIEMDKYWELAKKALRRNSELNGTVY